MSMLILVGESASGKTTIRDLLVEKYNMNKVIGCTSRKPRPGEKTGVDYYFTTKAKFIERMKAGEFLECEEFDGNMYGTLKNKCTPNSVLTLGPEGMKTMRQHKDLNPIVVYIKVPDDIKLERLKARGSSAEEIQSRIETDKIKFENAEQYADHVVESYNVPIEEIVSNIYNTVKPEAETVQA